MNKKYKNDNINKSKIRINLSNINIHELIIISILYRLDNFKKICVLSYLLQDLINHKLPKSSLKFWHGNCLNGVLNRIIYLSIYLSICLSICLSNCLSIYLFVYLSIYLSVYLSDYQSNCMYLRVLSQVTWPSILFFTYITR